MTNICVCIEGQVRGAKRCAPTIRKHLIDKYKADLFFVIQNYEQHDPTTIALYGPNKGIFLYENPTPSFTALFDSISKEYEIQPKWRETFKEIPSHNYTLGFNTPGTCIRRMYNRFVMYNLLRHYEYEWFVIIRSDLLMVKDFPPLDTMDPSGIYTTPICSWGGENNNLLVVHKSVFRQVTTYLLNFLNGQFLQFYKDISKREEVFMNEEKFFQLHMQLNKVSIRHIEPHWYISADEQSSFTTWASLKQAPNGDIYKYKDYEYVMGLLQNNPIPRPNTEYFTPTPTPTNQSLSRFQKIMNQFPEINIHIHQYGAIYEKCFSPFTRQTERLKILVLSHQEKGVQTHYLRFWHTIFDGKVDIICVEKNPNGVRYNGIYSYIQWFERVEDLPDVSFDIIVDTMVQWPSAQQMLLKRLWRCVRPKGVYVMENVKTTSHEHGISTKMLFETWQSEEVLVYSAVFRPDELRYFKETLDSIQFGSSCYPEWTEEEKRNALLIFSKK